MVEKISNHILNYLNKGQNFSNERKEILLFGITRIVEDVPKMLGMLLICFFLDIIYEMIIVTGIVIVYKTFIGGVHAKTNIHCFISSVIFYLSIIYSAKYLLFTAYIAQQMLYVILFFFGLYVIYVYVPADVIEIPKINTNLRKRYKFISIIMLSTIYTIAFVCIKQTYIQRLVIYTTFYINLMSIRIVYKLFKTTYGFETYMPEDTI